MILLPHTTDIHFQLLPQYLHYFYHTTPSLRAITSNSTSVTTMQPHQSDLFPDTLNSPPGDKARKRLRLLKCPICTKEFSPKTVPGYRRYLCSLECFEQHKRDLELYLEAKFTRRCKTIHKLRVFAQSQSKPNPTRRRKKAVADVVPSSAPARVRKKLKPRSDTDGQ